MQEDDDNPSKLVIEFDIPEPVPEPEPLPPQQSHEDLKAALAQEHFLEITADAELELISADRWAAYQMIDAGLLEACSGKYVAVLRRQFVGADEDCERLLNEVSSKYAVHPNRVVMIFFDDGW